MQLAVVDGLACLLAVIVCLVDLGRFYLAGYGVNVAYLLVVALFSLVTTLFLIVPKSSSPAPIKSDPVVEAPVPAPIVIKPKNSLRSAKKLKTKEARMAEITGYIYG